MNYTTVINEIVPGPNSLKVVFTPPFGSNPAYYTYSYLITGNSNYIPVTNRSDNTFLISNLANQLYSVTVVAFFDGFEPTPPSNTVQATPYYKAANPPQITELLPGPGSLTVSFTPPSGGNPSSYTYSYSADGGDTFQPVTNLAGNTFVITGLAIRRYFVAIKAINLGGISGSSNTLYATPLPFSYTPATAPYITDVSSIPNGLVVKFNRSVGGYPELTNYFFSLDGGLNYYDTDLANPLTDTSFEIVDLTEPATYNVTMFSTSSNKWTSLASNTVVGKPYVAGQAPEMTRFDTSFYQIGVHFQNSGAYPEPTAYYYSMDEGATWVLANVDNYSFFITNLSSYSVYNICIKSLNLVGYSPSSAISSVITDSVSAFYGNIMNASYNRRSPIIIGAQPKFTQLPGSTNLNVASTKTKYSRYVGGTAGSRR